MSQTPKSSASGAAVVSDLQSLSPAAQDSHGHAEVSPFDKVRRTQTHVCDAWEVINIELISGLNSIRLLTKV